MSILDDFFNIFRKKQNPGRRAYDYDERLIFTLKNAALQQGRTPEEILHDAVKLGDERALQQKRLVELWDTLSAREQEVTSLICLQYNRNQIAEVLGVTPGTVRTHMESIYKKFNVHTAKHLATLLKDWDMLAWWENRQR
jgi:DNA-binding CsgD family transcriptional regulator